MWLLKLRHIDGDHVSFTTIKHIGKGKCSFGLSNTTGPDQHEHTNGFAWIIQIGPESSDPPGNRVQGFTLSNHSLRQSVFQM